MKLYAITAITLLSVSVPSHAGGGDTEAYRLAHRCISKEEGEFKVLKSSVVNLDTIVGGDGETAPFCVLHTSCFITAANPSGSPGHWPCRYIDGKCQSPEACLISMKEGNVFGYGPSKPSDKAYVSRSGWRCIEEGSGKVLYSDFVNAKRTSDYKAVCRKKVSCTPASGGNPEPHEFLICPTKGRKVFTQSGKDTEFDVCPSADECYDTKIDLPTEDQYQQKIAQAEKKRIAGTLSRGNGSGSSSSISPSSKSLKRH